LSKFFFYKTCIYIFYKQVYSHLEFSGHFEFIFWQQFFFILFFFEFVLQEYAKTFAFWSFWRLPELLENEDAKKKMAFLRKKNLQNTLLKAKLSHSSVLYKVKFKINYISLLCKIGLCMHSFHFYCMFLIFLYEQLTVPTEQFQLTIVNPLIEFWFYEIMMTVFVEMRKGLHEPQAINGWIFIWLHKFI
jgi:hypothetical protein